MTKDRTRRREYERLWYAAHRETITAKRREHYKANRERLLSRRRERESLRKPLQLDMFPM